MGLFTFSMVMLALDVLYLWPVERDMKWLRAFPWKNRRGPRAKVLGAKI